MIRAAELAAFELERRDVDRAVGRQRAVEQLGEAVALELGQRIEREIAGDVELRQRRDVDPGAGLVVAAARELQLAGGDVDGAGVLEDRLEFGLGRGPGLLEIAVCS